MCIKTPKLIFLKFPFFSAFIVLIGIATVIAQLLHGGGQKPPTKPSNGSSAIKVETTNNGQTKAASTTTSTESTFRRVAKCFYAADNLRTIFRNNIEKGLTSVSGIR